MYVIILGLLLLSGIKSERACIGAAIQYNVDVHWMNLQRDFG